MPQLEEDPEEGQIETLEHNSHVFCHNLYFIMSVCHVKQFPLFFPRHLIPVLFHLKHWTSTVPLCGCCQYRCTLNQRHTSMSAEALPAVNSASSTKNTCHVTLCFKASCCLLTCPDSVSVWGAATVRWWLCVFVAWFYCFSGGFCDTDGFLWVLTVCVCVANTHAASLSLSTLLFLLICLLNSVINLLSCLVTCLIFLPINRPFALPQSNAINVRNQHFILLTDLL